MEQNIEEEFKQFQDDSIRSEEEKEDQLDNIIPPADIIAFTEQRSCADLYRMYQKGQLDINPDFQRGEVWSNKSQTLFIDSLLKQLPIPSMCISLDIKTQKRLMIDGLQRITSIIKFLDEPKDWRLAKTDDVDTRLSGNKTSEIRLNEPQIFDSIENVTIPITVLRCDYTNDNHMEYLFQIFNRLNTGGNKLYNQEIRNCIYQGSFNQLLKDLARSEEWLTFAHTTEKKVEKARLSNEERILRFFAFLESYKNYNGKLAKFLNDYMKNKKDTNTQELDSLKDIFISTLTCANKILEKIESKNVADAILIGIANNLEHLQTIPDDKINDLYLVLMQEKEFSEDELKEGIGSKEKVINRIDKSIEFFSRD